MTLEDVLANDDFLTLRAPEGRRVGRGSVSLICARLASTAVWMIAFAGAQSKPSRFMTPLSTPSRRYI